MAQDYTFNLSEPFTPNATILPTPTQDVSISFLSNTSGEAKTAQEIYTSPDSCVFYTPECSSHNSEVFIVPPSPLMNGDPVCSDVSSNYQQDNPQYDDPLFSTNATEFICNLHPPNSGFTKTNKIRPRISVLPNQKSPKSSQSSPVISKKLFTQTLRSTRNKVFKCQYCPNTFNHPTRY